MSILNPKWKYMHSTATDIKQTLEKFGFKPTTAEERAERQRRLHPDQPDQPKQEDRRQQRPARVLRTARI
jgi:hypothetical protein